MININKNKILVLVAGESNLEFIKAAKRSGLYVITCDNDKSNPGHKIADENLFIDVYDHEAIIKAIKGKGVNSVMTFVSAHGLKTASIISEYYNLNGYSQTTLKTLMDKGLFRRFLSDNDLSFPSYQCVQEFEHIKLDTLNYPIIIKPTDSGGSQGVVRINNESELNLNFNNTKSLSPSDTVIIEEFIEGEALINGDCLIYDGEIIGHLIGDYIYDNEVNEVLPIATVFPTKYDLSLVLKQLSKIVKALKIPDGIINFEAIIEGEIPYIVEINPRPSGNYIWKLMERKYSINIPKLLIGLYNNISKGINVLNKPNNYSYAYQLIYSAGEKEFTGFKLPSRLKDNVIDVILFKDKNVKVNSFRSLHDRIGIILLEFKDENHRLYYKTNTFKFKL